MHRNVEEMSFGEGNNQPGLVDNCYRVWTRYRVKRSRSKMFIKLQTPTQRKNSHATKVEERFDPVDLCFANDKLVDAYAWDDKFVHISRMRYNTPWVHQSPSLTPEVVSTPSQQVLVTLSLFLPIPSSNPPSLVHHVQLSSVPIFPVHRPHLPVPPTPACLKVLTGDPPKWIEDS